MRTIDPTKTADEETKARHKLARALVALCKKYGYTKSVWRLEDREIVITYTWSPAIDNRAKLTAKKAARALRLSRASARRG